MSQLIFKIGVFKNLCNIHRKTSVLESLLEAFAVFEKLMQYSVYTSVSLIVTEETF